MTGLLVGVSLGIAYCWAVDLVAKRAHRRRCAAAAPPSPSITITGVENLDREPGMARAITIGGVHFVAMDDYTDLVVNFAQRMEADGRRGEALGARSIAAHLGDWSLGLDLEAVEKSR